MKNCTFPGKVAILKPSLIFPLYQLGSIGWDLPKIPLDCPRILHFILIHWLPDASSQP